MNQRLVVVGTDTGVGKTTFAAALAGALDGVYWKPVQAGDLDQTDSDAVLRLSGVAPEQILPEAYRLTTPASPHLAAEIDGITIDPKMLVLPECGSMRWMAAMCSSVRVVVVPMFVSLSARRTSATNSLRSFPRACSASSTSSTDASGFSA